MIQALKNLFERAWPTIENPKTPLSSDALLEAVNGSGVAKSGQRVSVDDALGYSPVFCAVDLISSTVAQVPWITYERYDVEGRAHRKRAYNVSAAYLLRRATSRDRSARRRLTANIFIAKILASALLYREGYAIIRRRLNGIPYSLEWVPSWRVKRMVTDNGSTYFEVTNIDRTVEEVDEPNMFVLHGLSIQEFGGMSLIEYARNTIGRQLGAEEYTDDFFKNHAVPQGWFKLDKELSEGAQRRFIRNVVARHGRGDRSKFGVLEDGMDWKESGVSPRDALLIDQLKFGIPEVSRFYRVPLHMLGDPSRQGWNTTGAENDTFVILCLGNWMNRLANEANDKLFSSGERDTVALPKYYSEFLTDAVFVANTKERYDAYAVAIQNGFMNRNEVRERENLDPYDGGDEFLTPMNHENKEEDEPKPSADSAPEPEPEETDENEEPRSEDRLRAERRLVSDQFARMARRIGGAATKAASKPDSYLRFVNRIGELHADPIARTIEPSINLVTSVTGEDPEELRGAVVDQMILRAVERFEAAATSDDLRGTVQTVADQLVDEFATFADELLKEDS